MSLTYDPTAIRYASTQEAYGQTWTLNKVEDDGAQVWRNSKGQEAIVPSLAATVRSSGRKPSSKFTPLPEVVDPRLYAEQEAATRPTLRINFTPEEKLTVGKAEDFYYSQSDCEITKKLYDRCFFVDQSKIDVYDRALTNSEILKSFLKNSEAIHKAKPLFGNTGSGRVSSTKPNESNKPKNRHGTFAGETYPKRKSCSKPVEGDRSVSEGDRYLYEYHLNEWWVIGKDGVQLQKPEPVSSYSFSNSRYPKVGDKKLAVDGKTVIRWDGQKWRNTTSLSVDEVQVAGDSLGVNEEVKAFKSDAYDDRIKNAIKAKIASHDLGNVTMSDTEIFNLLTKVYK